MFDLIVVGGGAAGISCANEAKRLGLNAVIIEKNQLGGSVKYARKINNFPPFPSISGKALFEKFKKFAEKSNLCVIFDEVEQVSFYGNLFQTKNKSGKCFEGRSVFIATGQIDYIKEEYSSFKGLIKKSEDALLENYAGRTIIVYGGGDVAFDIALSLSDSNAKTMVICRSEPKAKPVLLKEAYGKKIEILPHCPIKHIQKFKDKKIVSLNKRGSTTEILCDEVVFATGKKPQLPKLNLPFEVENFDQSTLQTLSKIGVFLGGDIIRGRNRNVGVAVGDGLTAAFNVFNFLKGEKNG